MTSPHWSIWLRHLVSNHLPRQSPTGNSAPTPMVPIGATKSDRRDAMRTLCPASTGSGWARSSSIRSPEASWATSWPGSTRLSSNPTGPPQERSSVASPWSLNCPVHRASGGRTHWWRWPLARAPLRLTVGGPGRSPVSTSTTKRSRSGSVSWPADRSSLQDRSCGGWRPLISSAPPSDRAHASSSVHQRACSPEPHAAPSNSGTGHARIHSATDPLESARPSILSPIAREASPFRRTDGCSVGSTTDCTTSGLRQEGEAQRHGSDGRRFAGILRPSKHRRPRSRRGACAPRNDHRSGRRSASPA